MCPSSHLATADDGGGGFAADAKALYEATPSPDKTIEVLQGTAHGVSLVSSPGLVLVTSSSSSSPRIEVGRVSDSCQIRLHLRSSPATKYPAPAEPHDRRALDTLLTTPDQRLEQNAQAGGHLRDFSKGITNVPTSPIHDPDAEDSTNRI